MRLSKYSDRITGVEEDAYLIDKEFALLNGYNEWEKSLPSWTLFQALSIFPEAKPIVKRELKEELGEGKKHLQELSEYYRKEENRIMDTEKSYKKAEEQ